MNKKMPHDVMKRMSTQWWSTKQTIPSHLQSKDHDICPFVPFSFGHCVVCSSSIYGFWLPLWYLQTLLMTSDIQVLAGDKHTNGAGLKGSDRSVPLLIIGSPTVTQISIHDTNFAQIRFHSKRPHTIQKMNDTISIDSTIARSMNARS